MAHFRKSHPYNPGYALPANVLAEPPGRGTIQGAYIPRRTFAEIPPGWTGGYDLPAYIKNENHGKGAATGKYIRRKTVSEKYKSPLEGYVGYADVKTISTPDEIYGMGGVPSQAKGESAVSNFGKEVADIVVSSLAKLPRSERTAASQRLFNTLDPKLQKRVTERTRAYLAQGYPPGDAYRKAIASATSQGFVEQMVKVGSGLKPKANSLGALGIWGSVKGASSKVKGWAETAMDKIGSAACKVVGSDTGKLGVTIGGAAVGAKLGGPSGAKLGAAAGSTGASLADNKCNPPPPPGAFGPGLFGAPSWAIPAAVGGGVLLLALAVSK